MNVDDLRILCNDETIQITAHTLQRMRERGIKLKNIKDCIMYGEVIESYPNDYPFPSALVSEYEANEKPIHVVAGVGDGYLWIITAYYPTNEKWGNNWRTRKEK